MKKSVPPFTIPATPIDQHEVAYFQVLGTWEDPYVTHVRCIYHVNTPWAVVCPDREREHGRDFEDQWQVFADGRTSGRTGSGWEAVLRRGTEYDWGVCFATFEEAKACALRQIERCLASAKEKVADIERRIEAARGALGRSFIQCPDCKRQEHEANHPTGMIFVGWGHGWQACTKCDGTGQIETERGPGA